MVPYSLHVQDVPGSVIKTLYRLNWWAWDLVVIAIRARGSFFMEKQTEFVFLVFKVKLDEDSQDDTLSKLAFSLSAT